MATIDSHRLLGQMERVTLSELASNVDEYFARMEQEDIGFILTESGVDKYVLYPYHWYFPEKELLQIEIEKALYDQVSELIDPMHISHEELILAFLRWCVDPTTQDQAIAWLKEASAR